jgi:tetratricopeptide (TPR) repeat protein
MCRPKAFAWGAVLVFFVLCFRVPGAAQYREYYLHGIVLDTHKQPLAGAEIRLRDKSTSRSYTFTTGKNGEFKFAGLPHGDYEAAIKKEGYAIKSEEWKFPTPQDRMQKVEIPPIVLVSQTQIQETERLKELKAEIQKAAEKIKQNDFDGSIALLTKLLEQDPKDPNALYFVGISYSRKKMYPEAIASLTEVTRLTPNFPAAYFELGLCYQQQEDLPNALENYQKNLELDPSNTVSAYNSGLILFGQARIDEALTCFEKALSLKPDDPEFLEMTGRCHINKGAFDKAVDCLEKAKAGFADPEKAKFLEDLIAKLKEQIRK